MRKSANHFPESALTPLQPLLPVTFIRKVRNLVNSRLTAHAAEVEDKLANVMLAIQRWDESAALREQLAIERERNRVLTDRIHQLEQHLNSRAAYPATPGSGTSL